MDDDQLQPTRRIFVSSSPVQPLAFQGFAIERMPIYRGMVVIPVSEAMPIQIINLDTGEELPEADPGQRTACADGATIVSTCTPPPDVIIDIQWSDPTDN